MIFWTFDSQNTATNRPCKIWSVAYSSRFILLYIFLKNRMWFWEFYCSTQMQKLPLKTFTAYFVAYFVVFAWAPSTRSSSLLTLRHVVLLSFAFFPRSQRGREGHLGKVFFIWIPWYLYLRIRLMAFKWFQIVPGKHRKHDVTTLLAYSHLNTPLSQSERTYHLSYFINVSLPFISLLH